MAGFLLASMAGGNVRWWRLAPAVAVSVLLYAAGLIQNDLAHVADDSRHRPERPLPSGTVSGGSARLVLCVLAVLAMAAAGATRVAATCHLAFALLVLITLYNHVTSRVRVLGPINMGLCRAVSLLVGASAVGGWASVLAPLYITAGWVLFAYVAAVTAIAQKETTATRIGPIRWLPAMTLVVGFGALHLYAVTTVSAHLLPLLLGAIAVSDVAIIWSLLCGWRLGGICQPQRVGQTIGMWVRGLLPIQAALVGVAVGEGSWVAAGLLAAWAVSGLLARRFASS
ncbi:hypothetical protein LCGC14_0181750 [marine sediment metagenome]|uniref:Prenyltransferase n=1 Tax=marine sediment metagenome TaxID=412755 RepID=A0A0F9X808_9ZZZZ|nr:hypothetical protein [Phycisphaerae bacterium]HDZ42534.1 hypothetical protein [Phycisphaerae bacterium]